MRRAADAAAGRAEPLPPLGCACASLRRAARAVTQLYEESLRATGLRATQFTLLQVLARRRTMTQGALGDFLAIDSTTLTRSLRPLADEGWIGASPGEDRREVHWSLTAAGERVVARARPAWERAQERLKARLTATQWPRLLDDLAAVAAAARS